MDELMRKIRDKPENAQNPLILQTKFYDVMVYSHKALLQFPKAEKYQLVANIKESEKECMHHIIDLEKKYTKKTTLQRIDTELEYLRCLIRIAYDCGYINVKRRHVWISQVDEVGRILGGLIKFFRQ